jgi:epsilon-lactone hydrolase
MPSLKSKIFNCLLRNRHLFQGKLKKEVFDFNTSIAGFRELCEKGAIRYSKIPKDISKKEQFIEGVKSEWLLPKGADARKLILYVHGGGYVSGSCNDHRGFVSKFAKKTGVDITFRSGVGMVHCYPLLVPMFKEATEAMDEIVNFIRRHLKIDLN